MAGNISNCICTTLIIGIISSIPIAMICLGVVRIDQCPMQPWVPKFMIISGGAAVVILLLSACVFGCKARGNSRTTTLFGVILALAVLFAIAWNIAGSVWVFQKWGSWGKVHGDASKGCHEDLYLFAFAYLVIFWITCPCQCGCVVKTKQAKKEEDV